MRQAGLKPKNHDSGVYWTRAASSNKSQNVESTPKWPWIIIGPVFVVVYPIIWILEKLK